MIFLYAMAANHCISPVDQDLGQPLNILVVEGFIDDDFGPHEIDVSLLANFGSIAEGGNKRPVEAQVRIFDDLGNSFPLRRETLIREEIFNADAMTCLPGLSNQEFTTNYMTSSTFRGVAGRSYGLEVILTNGTVYRSNMQLLPQSPQLDSVFVEFSRRPSENDLQDRTGVDVFAIWEDDATANNFHFFDIEGTYKIETPDRTDGLTCCLYNPLDGGATSCWVIESIIEGIEGPLSDRLTNGQRLIQRAGFVEDDGRRFSSSEVPPDRQYHLEVSLYSMNQAAFDFLNNIEILSEIDGEIFDPPPVGARGNIINIADPNEQVVGFFGVYGKATRSTFVRNSILENIQPSTLCGDCRQFANGQLEVPEPYR